jgi:hypothetical protein
VKIYDSWSRFDETKQFTGVFHQANRPLTDADINEEVRIRSTDVWRRTADLAEGSPDAGFQISDAHLLDGITSTEGWAGEGLPPDDQRVVERELSLDRREPAGLPFVLRSRGHVALRRTLPAERDLTSLPAPSRGLPSYAASALRLAVRFERASNDQDTPDVRLLLQGPDGEVSLPTTLGAQLPSAWTELRFPIADLAAAGVTRISGWGLTGLPPRARVYVDALLVEVSGIGRNDFVIRGGNGTLTGAGRMLAQGQRALIPADLRYAFQPDYPEPPPLLSLIPGGPPASGTPPEDGHFLVYLDVTLGTVTWHDDPSLVEPALDGLDTTARQRVVSQVRARWIGPGEREALPPALGGGTLTTVFSDTDTTPLRYPPAAPDLCRDRCLFTESIATGRGYRGSENINVRVEVLAVGGRPAFLLARDNGSTLVRLSANAQSGASTLKVSPSEAGLLAAGDLIVIEDRVTRLQPDGPRLPVLRRLRSVEAATGTLELEPAGATTGPASDPLPVGGPLPGAFSVDNGAAVRRWDAADWLVPGVRYNFPDNVEFVFGGSAADYVAPSYWTFIARIVDPDGQARGRLERLSAAPPQGPVHHVVPLARVRERAGRRELEDVRPRYLPLTQVRDRLRELEREDRRGTFTLVVGDGVLTHGDIDQDTAQGVTGDEAVQDALSRLAASGGTLYLRAGSYTFERPVLVRGASGVRVLGDGAATFIRSVGAGGAFLLDRCGEQGTVSLERLRILEDPAASAIIGAGPDEPLPPEPSEAPLELVDLRAPSPAPAPTAALADRLRTLVPGQGRAMGSLIATLEQLRRIQHQNQGLPLEDVPEAAALLEVLRRLPHGVVTLSDSANVQVLGCELESREPLPLAAGLLITGYCRQIAIDGNRIAAASGVAALPLASFLSPSFLLRQPIAALRIEGLLVQRNRLIASGDGVHGVHIADGTIDGLELRQNQVEGYAVGIAVHDQVEQRAQAPVDRISIADNRVLGSRVLGVQITGDGADVVGNEIRNAASTNLLASSGLFHAALQVLGQSVRVRDCSIQLPALGNVPVLGACAAIVVGDGMDDGSSSARGVFDVEIADNRIEGAGASTPASGVLLGGPQAVYDVRIRGNIVRNLGDAAVRVLGSAVAVGRLRIESNRIEQVALAEVAHEDLDVRAQLSLLGGELPGGIETLSRPQPLLESLLAQPGSPNRPALDAVLRWLEGLTLRGAIVLSRLAEGEVSGNRIAGVGRFIALSEPRALGAEVRTAGVALVGGRDVVIENNQIEDVRAPATLRTPAASGASSAVPAAFQALELLSLAAPPATGGAPDALEVAVDASDLHSAVGGAHRLLAIYTREPAQRLIHGRRLYGVLDGLSRAIIAQPGPNAEVGKSLAQLAAIMRSTQSEERHTELGNTLRAVLSHIGRVTAANVEATRAWRALEDFDGAIAGPDSITRRREVAARLLQDEAALLAGVPDARAGAILGALRMTADAADGPFLDSVDQLAWLAALRDEQARTSPISTQPVGSRKEILQSLAGGLKSTVGSLRNTNDPQSVLARLRGQTRALSKTLRESGSELEAYVEADFRAIDRVEIPREGQEIERFLETLDRVVNVARAPTGPSETVLTEADAEAAVRLARTRADTALRVLVVDHIDEQVARLQALAQVSDPLVEAGLGVLQASMFQLAGLVEGDAELRPLSAAALMSVREAISSAGASRVAKLGQIRERVNKLVDPERIGAVTTPVTPTPTSSAGPAPEAARRLAGLGALLLTFDELRQQPSELRERGLELYAAHLPLALSETRQGTNATRAALAAFDTARPTLAGEFDAGATSAEEQFRLAVLSLAGALDTMGSDATDEDDTPPLLAAAALLSAVKLAFDSADPARIDVVKDFLGAHKADISAAVVDQLLAQPELSSSLRSMRRALERLALGELPTAQVAAEPEFSTEPDPADGVFAAAVDSRLEVVGNKIESALIGVSVVAAERHVLAEPLPAAAGGGALLVDISSNRIHGCAVGALDIAPGVNVVANIAQNQVLACGDLGAREAAALAASASSFGSAIVRCTGKGDLMLSNNLFSGNGHGHPNALLHEVLADWRGDVVVRGNTIRHRGGGAGGVGLLLLLETLAGTAGEAASLIKRLAQAPALAVEPPPKPKAKAPVIRAPSRALLSLELPLLGAVASSHYIERARVAPAALTLLDRLQLRPILRLPPRPVPQRRSAHVEGNQVVASGPALLVLAAGTDVVSAAVVGNELRSERRTGAVYLRGTDATVFTGNHCECLGAVNVVVMRPDAAPVSATGNVILGEQTVAQVDPVVVGRRIELKSFLKAEIASAISLDLAAVDGASDPASEKAASAEVAPLALAQPSSAVAASGVATTFTADTFRFVRPSDLKLNLFKDIVAAPGAAVPAAPAPSPSQVPAVTQAPSPVQDPGAFSLVILGGTRVVAAGNATSAGALTLDADQRSELNV